MPSLSCTGEEGWGEGELIKESRKGRPSLSTTGEEGWGEISRESRQEWPSLCKVQVRRVGGTQLGREGNPSLIKYR